jgi:hypothetical protein
VVVVVVVVGCGTKWGGGVRPHESNAPSRRSESTDWSSQLRVLVVAAKVNN